MSDPLDVGLNFEDESDLRDNKCLKRTAIRNEQVNFSGHQKPYQCPNCPSAYNRQDNLTQHLRYVCLRKPRFACPYCTYVAKRTSNVYVHIRSKHPNRKICYKDLEKSDLVTPNLK